MEIDEMNAVQCILHQIEEFERRKETNFDRLRKAVGQSDGGEAEFSMTLLEPCHGEVSIGKEHEGDRVGSIRLKFADPTTITVLAGALGEFKHLPATPSRKWAAMVRRAAGTEAFSYAILAESDTKIQDDTPIHRIHIRIDYED